jgi:hypothetical protein
MTDAISHPVPEPDDPQAAVRAAWIRGLAAALRAGGLTAQLNETAGCLDVTVTVQHPGRKPTDVIVDEDGYIEIRWWSSPDATAQQVAGVITRALATLSAGPVVAGPNNPQP